MIGHTPNVRPAVGLLAAVLIASAQPSVFADTIYLKNGRVITTSHAEVKGDELVFVQFGGEVRIPMALVQRVERDQERGEAPSSALPDRPSGKAPKAGSGGNKSEAVPPKGDKVTGAGTQDKVPPEQTREYWQQRLRAILDEKAQLQAQMPELRHQERAFLFSHRSSAETKRKIEAVQKRLQELDQALAELRREARRKGIPPGWVRVSAS